MIRSGFAGELIADDLVAAALDKLLKLGLIIGDVVRFGRLGSCE